ncbi:MAG: HutD family protein, partial [Planctomycetaceae bacterium]
MEKSGPFSIFAGIDRITCVVDGDGMDLRHEDGSVVAL